MIKLIGGPADGVELWLRRAPVLLRVVTGPDGVDALDQLTDEPAANERIDVYKLRGRATWIHLCARGKDRGRAGRWMVAEYDFLETPDDDLVRETAAWRSWAQSRIEAAE